MPLTSANGRPFTAAPPPLLPVVSSSGDLLRPPSFSPTFSPNSPLSATLSPTIPLSPTSPHSPTSLTAAPLSPTSPSSHPPTQPARILILCLGDLGRSPRMQYHALSCARSGMSVDFVGYSGTDCMSDVVSHPLITLHRFHPATNYSIGNDAAAGRGGGGGRVVRVLMLPIRAGVKLSVQTVQLMYTMLIRCSTPDYLLVQNPPSIPTLLIAAIVSILRSASLIIDWHNFGYSLVGLSLGASHRLTQLSRLYEHVMAHTATSHLCVTRAMQQFLLQKWGVRATVLYDRPPVNFRRLTADEKHELWVELQEKGYVDVAAVEESLLGRRIVDGTLMTVVKGADEGGVCERTDRPLVLISSTSWTADEDFSMLITAVTEYDRVRNEEVREAQRRQKRGVEEESKVEGDEDGDDVSDVNVADEDVTTSAAQLLHTISVLRRHRHRQHITLPPLLVLITGKGPLLQSFLATVSELHLPSVYIATLFLPFHLYPLLLGSSDVGLSFHTSSSGLDLPMKVVDMFGAELPVLAVGFNCLGELVEEGKTGYVFSDGMALAQLVEVMATSESDSGAGGWMSERGRIGRMRVNVKRWADKRWDEPWHEHAAPLFITSAPSPSSSSHLLSTAPAYVSFAIASIPPHYRTILLLMLVAVLFRVSWLPLPSQLPSVPPVSSWSVARVWESVLLFVSSEWSSVLVVGVMVGVLFWLLVAYWINRKVAEEAKSGRRGAGSRVSASGVLGAGVMGGGMGLGLDGESGGRIREVYTSSEEEKEE